jgi:hypothetical protein
MTGMVKPPFQLTADVVYLVKIEFTFCGSQYGAYTKLTLVEVAPAAHLSDCDC